MRLVDVLRALPQGPRVAVAFIEPQRPGAEGERGKELGELLRLGAAPQHGAHRGGHVPVPAVIAHGAPEAVAVDLHSAGAPVQTARQPDGPHLCTDAGGRGT